MSVVLPAAVFGQDDVDPYEELGLHSQSSGVVDEVVEDEDRELASDGLPQDPTEEDVFREYARFIRLLEDQNYDEADISAKRVIEMSIRIYGPQSHETAKALNNLAVVQNSNGQYDAAVQNFTSTIDILEILEDRLNSQLVNPLKGLGAAQLGGGRPDLATLTLARATHITHVNDGPHNIEQVEILESLAEANVRLGDLDSARDVLDRIHILNVRHFADDALGLLPSLMRRASWQHRAGYYNDERATYRRAIRVIEEAAGRNDPRLVDPLVKLGQSFYYIEPLSGSSQSISGGATGEVYLKRANRIAERSENFPWLEMATTKLALADYYIYSESYSRAKKIYTAVWENLSAGDDRLEMRRELLEQPGPIWEESLPPSTNGAVGLKSRKGEIQNGRVLVTYKVTQRGRVRITDVKTEPEEFKNMERMVHREIKRRMYRPPHVDGVSVGSENRTFTHEFLYHKAELEELREKATEKEAAAASS